MRVLSALLACLMLAACSGVEMKPGEKSHRRQEVPPGPGLLTGKQGEFVIFRWDGPASADENAEEEEQSPSDSQAPN